MAIKSFKSALYFWQEIVFAIALGILVFGITMNISVAFKQGINIVFYCVFILLLLCLIGQLYWKNAGLALWLAGMLGFGSAYMILAALSDLTKMTPDESGYIKTVFALFLSMGLTATAFTMPFKYLKSFNSDKAKSSN